MAFRELFKHRKLNFVLIIFIITSVVSAFDRDRAEQLYIEQCSKCHRKSGKGVKYVYPPLKDSDYVKKESAEELLRGMIYGRSGKILVNGITYNGVMTTEIDKSLTDSDVAIILNYVLKELNDDSRTVNDKDVQSARKKGKLPVK